MCTRMFKIHFDLQLYISMNSREEQNKLKNIYKHMHTCTKIFPNSMISMIQNYTEYVNVKNIPPSSDSYKGYHEEEVRG